jgi:hypothetical protein
LNLKESPKRNGSIFRRLFAMSVATAKSNIKSLRLPGSKYSESDEMAKYTRRIKQHELKSNT